MLRDTEQCHQSKRAKNNAAVYVLFTRVHDILCACRDKRVTSPSHGNASKILLNNSRTTDTEYTRRKTSRTNGNTIIGVLTRFMSDFQTQYIISLLGRDFVIYFSTFIIKIRRIIQYAQSINNFRANVYA